MTRLAGILVWLLAFSVQASDLHTNGATIWATNPPPQEKYSLIGYMPNTVHESHWRSMSNLFDGVVSNDVSATYWSTIDPSQTNYVRNPASVLAGLDLTGVSPMRIWNGIRSQSYSAAIGRRYISGADHIVWFPGMQVVFFDLNDRPVIRAIVSNYVILADINIGILDSNLPESIRHFKVWPDLNIWRIYPRVPAFDDDLYRGEFWRGMTHPCFGINQFGNVHVIDYYTQKQEIVNEFNAAFKSMYQPGLLSKWYPDWSYTIHNGDSSTPVFSLLGTNIIYWGAWWSDRSFQIVGSGNSASIADGAGTNFLDAMNLDEFTFYDRPKAPIHLKITEP